MYVLDSLFAQPLSKSSLVYLLVRNSPYSAHLFNQSSSSFRNTCPCYHNLFCCSTKIMSSNPSLSLNSLLITFILTSHIHLTILISAHWSAILFAFLTGLVSLPCNILLRTQLLYSLTLNTNEYVNINKHLTCWLISSACSCDDWKSPK